MNRDIFENIALHEAMLIYRRRMGLSIREAADRAKLPRAMWESFERGKHEYLHLSHLIRMFEVLGYGVSINLVPMLEEQGGGE